MAAVSLSAAAGTVTYFHNDLLGSPIAATNASGQVIWRESYRPYGERLANDANSSANKVWYTSRRQDAETGLVYMGARYYDPVVGRFMGLDPKLLNETNPHSFNRYSYANNNPSRYVDPNGRQATMALCIAGPEGCIVGLALTAAAGIWVLNSGSDKKGPNNQISIRSVGPDTQGTPPRGPDDELTKAAVTIDENRAQHIFRDAEGHLEDTAFNRNRLESVANDPSARLGADKWGNTWAARLDADGQIWVQIRDDRIINGGVNQIPRQFNSVTGLSSPLGPPSE